MKLLLLLIGAVAFANAAFKTCDRKTFSKVGCYKRDTSLLSDMILNGRETTKEYMPESGLISWRQYNDYIHSLACECAEKAKSLKYAFFAIGFYGECFAGKDRTRIVTSLAQSTQSSQCIKGDFQKCEASSGAGSHECVGSASHEYIYSIQEDTNSDDNKNVNGGYGDWSEWTKCDKDCGEGSQMRERACNNPLPQGAGANCEELGAESETRTCTLKQCPVDGQWSAFGSFGQCSKSCGGGSQVRTRTCTSPAPQHGGKTCEGSASNSASCNTQACPASWTGARNGCIAGRHIKTYNNIQTIQACGELCDKEMPPCKSVDWHPTSKACHFNNCDLTTCSLHSPCQGYKFSQPQ